jgi:branched-chain amino acid transport system substrate-binding protein
MDAVAVMGPVFSGMVAAGMDEIRANGIPTFVGGEATDLTLQGNPYLFRTSLSQAAAMPGWRATCARAWASPAWRWSGSTTSSAAAAARR